MEQEHPSLDPCLHCIFGYRDHDPMIPDKPTPLAKGESHKRTEAHDGGVSDNSVDKAVESANAISCEEVDGRQCPRYSALCEAVERLKAQRNSQAK